MGKSENNWQAEPKRDVKLGALIALAQSESDCSDVLPWSRVEALIQTAPRVKPSFLQRLTWDQPRPLRYALAPAAALAVLIGTLAAIPAQSSLAGVIVMTELPSAWDADSQELADFQTSTGEAFNSFAPEGAELFVLDTVDAASQRPRLALTMLHLGEQQARAFYSQLQATYPALVAFEPDFVPVDSKPSGSLLTQALASIGAVGQLAGLDDDSLKIRLLHSIREAGLEPVNVVIERQADGTAVVEVDAVMRFSLNGHKQEDLDAAGIKATQ